MRIAKTWHLWQLLLLLAVIALLPVLLAGAWAVKSTMDRHRSEVERSALDLSRALATAVGGELESTLASLRTLTQLPALANGRPAEFYDIAQRARQEHPSWNALILADAGGNLLFSTSLPYGTAGASVVDPESLARVIRTRQATVGSALRGPRGRIAFPVRVPVMRESSLAYVLSAAVAPERFLDILQQQKVPADWTVAVFDNAGQRVARSRDHEHTAPSPSLTRLLSTAASEGVGMTTTLEGTESVTAFTRVQGHGWTVAVAIPDPRIGQVWQGMIPYFAGALATLLAWGLAAAWLSRRIAASVDALRERAVSLVCDGKVLASGESRIREINEADAALVALSRERAEVEADRERLLASLNAALDASRLALSQAEEAGRAKDNFLAMLGHELRNPLAPIVSALDLLDLRGKEHGAAERAILRRQVNHLHRLVDDLLDASRIVQGKLEVRKEQVDLRQVGLWAHEALRSAIAETRTRLELDLPEDPLYVEGDSSRLTQAITNLLSNAAHFTPDGTVRLLIGRDDGNAVIVVEDNGAGMDAETLRNAFQPFFQAPQSLARSRGGLGLGLAIVRTVVQLHGGSVRAASDGLGQGSRFEIRLPHEPCPAPQPQGQAEASAGESRRLLVVDDNVDAGELIAAGLSAAGHHVRIANSAAEALALMPIFRPQVAILDIGMPDMDGYQLAREMRSRDPGWNGRLIALSGYGQGRDKEQARMAGFDHHLTKPVGFAELNQVVSGLPDV